MKKMFLLAFAIGMIIPAVAHHQKTRVHLSLWNLEPFNITVNGCTYNNVVDFEEFLRPGEHFVKIWTHHRRHNGGHVRVLHKGYINIGNRGNVSGIVTQNGRIRWERSCNNNNRAYNNPNNRFRDLDDLYFRMDRCALDNRRLQIALDYTINMQLTALEFEMIMTHFKMDYYRYEFARNRYQQCSEPQYFYRCANTIRNTHHRRVVMAYAHRNGGRYGRRYY